MPSRLPSASELQTHRIAKLEQNETAAPHSYPHLQQDKPLRFESCSEEFPLAVARRRSGKTVQVALAHARFWRGWAAREFHVPRGVRAVDRRLCAQEGTLIGSMQAGTYPDHAVSPTSVACEHRSTCKRCPLLRLAGGVSCLRNILLDVAPVHSTSCPGGHRVALVAFL